MLPHKSDSLPSYIYNFFEGIPDWGHLYIYKFQIKYFNVSFFLKIDLFNIKYEYKRKSNYKR